MNFGPVPHLKRCSQAARQEGQRMAIGLVRMDGRKIKNRMASRAASARNLQICQQAPRKPVRGAAMITGEANSEGLRSAKAYLQ